MSNDILQTDTHKFLNNNTPVGIPLFVTKLKNSIWIFGVHSWLFGITDRGFASLADGYLTAVELAHIFTASFFFLSWLYLKPKTSLTSSDASTSTDYPIHLSYEPEVYLGTARSRMWELREQHLIRQEYILPFPYFCQIFHLLNLKHLETIHNFSLNNLRVIKVSNFQATDIGGMIKFQTTLESPFNALRIWRPAIVEVGLILHSPHTVELCIPVYNDKYITVIFNAVPLSDKEHKFFIDIYSNLGWPKLLLQIVLHFAACLTLYEDLPYLRKLAQTNVSRLINLSRVSAHETTWLFRRFVDLYGSGLEASQPVKAIP